MPTTRCSNKSRPRRITSRWPSVIGSNVPVNTAIRDGSEVRGCAVMLMDQVVLHYERPEVAEALVQPAEVVLIIIDVRADPEPAAAAGHGHPAVAERPGGPIGIDPRARQGDDPGDGPRAGTSRRPATPRSGPARGRPRRA